MTQNARPMFPVRLAAGLIAAALIAGQSPAQADPASSPNPSPNAGATPVEGQALFQAFHGQPGIERVVDRLVDLSAKDPRIADVFENKDLPHLKTQLSAQFCYLLNGPCAYTGKDMKTAHKDMGLRMSDFNALVENLQKAMDAEGVAFAAQNRLLAKLAPMERVTVER